MNSSTATPGPPTLTGQLLLLALAGWGVVALYPMAQHGNGPAGIAVVGLTGLAILAAIKAFNALDLLLDRRRRHRQLESFADAQGEAKVGDASDARKAGLLSGEGFILGRVGNKLIRYAGEAAVLVCGRPGSWKGVAFVLLNLLQAPKPTRKKFQSYIVTDVSGELYAVAHRRLQDLGYRVLVIASEAERLSRELGVTIETVRHNPAGYLDPTDPALLVDVKSFVQLLHKGAEPSKQNGTNEHFDKLARLVLTTFILWLLDRYGEVTLPGLRRCVMSTKDELHCLLEEACESRAFGNALSESSSAVLSLMGASPEEFSGAMTTATSSVELFAAGSPVGDQVSEHLFDWGELKEQPTVVFVIVPPERLKSQAQFIELTIAASAEALARHRSNRRVVYLLDEVANLYLPNLMTIISLYRKFGLQVVLILQQLEAQLARIYGREAAREIQGNCEVILALSTTELDDLKRLSELSGNETFRNGSHSLRETTEGAPEVSYSGDYRQRPVLRPETIRLLEKHRAVLLMAGVTPFVVDLVNYLQEPAIKRLADENPFYIERRDRK